MQRTPTLTVDDSPLEEPAAQPPLDAVDAVDDVDDVLEEELLVEEVSIDGMCGVY
jgi:mycofactocin precursor